MKNFHLDYQKEVRRQVCPVHNVSPSINLVDGKIVLKCCCKDFKIKRHKIIIEALSTYKKEHPLKNFGITHKLKVAYNKYADVPIKS